MRWMAISMLIIAACDAACGGSSVEWAGRWKQPLTPQIGSYVECTLGGSGQTVTGSGVQHREAGTNLPFTVTGTVAVDGPRGMTFAYEDSTNEVFGYTQPDHDHITLTNFTRTVNLTRQ